MYKGLTLTKFSNRKKRRGPLKIDCAKPRFKEGYGAYLGRVEARLCLNHSKKVEIIIGFECEPEKLSTKRRQPIKIGEENCRLGATGLNKATLRYALVDNAAATKPFRL